MAYADTLPDNVRRKARILAISSAVSGCISEVMLDYSAIIILLLRGKSTPTNLAMCIFLL